jgi:ubiquinone/menaquinone biosynthesis C-methylase UbiE
MGMPFELNQPDAEGLGRFDDLAGRYEDWFATGLGAFVARQETALLLELLRPAAGERVLEVGAGTGYFLRAVARTGARCVGLDPSVAMLAVAKVGGGDGAIGYVRGRGEALPFPDGGFDALLAMTVLEFVADVEAVVAEAVRVVRPGGRLVFGVLNVRGPWARARRRQGGLWAAARFFTAVELGELLAPYGRVQLVYGVHVPPWAGSLPAPVIEVTDQVLRRLMPASGALIAAQLVREES